MSDKPLKATVSFKAENLSLLIDALSRILDVNIQCVTSAAISLSMTIEAEDASDLQEALGDIARAVGLSEGVEAKISAPATVWHGRRLDPTPMERMINQATGELR